MLINTKRYTRLRNPSTVARPSTTNHDIQGARQLSKYHGLHKLFNLERMCVFRCVFISICKRKKLYVDIFAIKFTVYPFLILVLKDQHAWVHVPAEISTHLFPSFFFNDIATTCVPECLEQRLKNPYFLYPLPTTNKKKNEPKLGDLQASPLVIRIICLSV